MTHKTGIYQRLGVALVVALGFEVVIAVVGGWAISTWESFQPREGVNESLLVCWDGKPLIYSYSYNQYGASLSNTTGTFRTLDGSPAPSSGGSISQMRGASLPIPQYTGVFPLQGYTRIGRFSDGQQPPVFWYFVDDGARDGRGYFEGYDSQSRRRTGYIGRSGFRRDRPPVEDWFPMDGDKLASDAAFTQHSVSAFPIEFNQSQSFNFPGAEFPAGKVGMISSKKVLEIDLRKGSVTTIFESPDVISAEILFTVEKEKTKGKGETYQNYRERLTVRTSDRIVVLGAEGKRQTVFEIPGDLRDQDFTMYELEGGKALLTTDRPVSKHGNPIDLIWIDGSGKVLRRETAVLNRSYRVDEGSEERSSALLVPAPAMLAFFAAAVFPRDALSSGSAAKYSAALAHSLTRLAVPLLLVSLLSVILAALCWRRHRRYFQPASGLWFVFVLLMGLPGLVGYLFHRRWPVREDCPACGRFVPRDRDACAACGAEFPPPPRKGIEVFA